MNDRALTDAERVLDTWKKPRVALIIGINYVDDKPKEPEDKKLEEVRGEPLKPLPNALKDAEAVEELLMKKGGFKEGEVTLVGNPTKKELQKALKEFKETIDKRDGQCVAILYYAGKQGELLQVLMLISSVLSSVYCSHAESLRQAQRH
jgi:hypothetical protein